MQIEQYTTEMADDVASLIEHSFIEHRDTRPLTFLNPTEPWTPRAELLATLRSERLCTRTSHVALHEHSPVAAALAVGEDAPGWWRIATAPGHRRQGLASACIEAGERALASAGRSHAHTEAVVDSRWNAAAALLRSHGYELDDPDQRNITMIADSWTPRHVRFPDAYSLDTLREENLDEWMAVRNAVFGGKHGPEWFRERFMSRPDYHAADWKIARHEGRIVGIAGAVCVEGDRDPRLRGAQIEWVGVLKEQRGLRLGQELVVACMNHAAERGFLPVLLLTQPFRVPAVRLYEKLGFNTVAAWQRWTKQLR